MKLKYSLAEQWNTVGLQYYNLHLLLTTKKLTQKSKCEVLVLPFLELIGTDLLQWTGMDLQNWEED
jgi:hypothetical protein